jgi:tetratricopeptide (TPR) repeat protein
LSPHYPQVVGDAYYDLGDHTRSVPTDSAAAQAWFDRGLVWAYAFNHEEAVACFERAAAEDPDLWAAHWGIAYAVGPNYNKGWEAFDAVDLTVSLARARAELDLARKAFARAEREGSPVGGPAPGLVAALTARYTDVSPEDADTWQAGHEAYADAMAEVADAYPNDLDVLSLAADALVNVTAWALWDPLTGEPAPGSRAREAERLLDAALALPGGDRHPFVLHLHIHLLEMSERPEAALPSADRLRGLVPDAGHLQHMPSHLDVLCGDYHASIAANRAAVAADRRFVERTGPLNFYSLYRAHDLHFIVYSAMFLGRFHDAIEAADELGAQLTPEVLRIESPPMADWLEAFVALRTHVLVRFGRWPDLVAQPLPEDRTLYCTTTAMTLYGRGVAYAATGDVAAAEATRVEFVDAVAQVPDTRYLFNNTALDILAIAGAMLDGELAYRHGRFDEAFTQLRRAIALDDALPYDEPWGWMQPTRHAYGALLLEQGRVEEAAAVYAADLGLDPSVSRSVHHPGNVWSLHGYHECLERLGRHEEARIIAQPLAIASARADVPVLASCACRLDVLGATASSGSSYGPGCDCDHCRGDAWSAQPVE